MKSIGVSNDLPDYLKSKYSVLNPSKRAISAHKAYKPTLRHGVSEESPKNFKVNYIPVLNSLMKNQEISKETDTLRFSSDLKQNSARTKARFDYSEIKSQKFDFDTLKFTEGMDVKAGNSARIQRAMAYSDQYSKTLGFGFGLPRGEFIVQLSQPNVPRSNISQISQLTQYIGLNTKRKLKSHHNKNYSSMNVTSSLEFPRHVNTPNQSMRKKKIRKQKIISLADLDEFEKTFKTKQSLWKSTSVYKDY